MIPVLQDGSEAEPAFVAGAVQYRIQEGVVVGGWGGEELPTIVLAITHVVGIFHRFESDQILGGDLVIGIVHGCCGWIR